MINGIQLLSQVSDVDFAERSPPWPSKGSEVGTAILHEWIAFLRLGLRCGWRKLLESAASGVRLRVVGSEVSFADL